MSEQPLLEVIFTAATHHYPPDHEQLRVPPMKFHLLLRYEHQRHSFFISLHQVYSTYSHSFDNVH